MSLPDGAPIDALRRRVISLADTKRLLEEGADVSVQRGRD